MVRRSRNKNKKVDLHSLFESVKRNHGEFNVFVAIAKGTPTIGKKMLCFRNYSIPKNFDEVMKSDWVYTSTLQDIEVLNAKTLLVYTRNSVYLVVDSWDDYIDG